MLAKFLLLFSAIVLLLGLLALLVFKAGTQLKYLRIKRGQEAGDVLDFMRFNPAGRELRERWEAFSLFPLMFPITFEEGESEALRELKKNIKRTHIGIYVLLIFLILIFVYAGKAYPGGMI